MVGMQADEEGMAWETYLQTYPNTVFGSRLPSGWTSLARRCSGPEVHLVRSWTRASKSWTSQPACSSSPSIRSCWVGLSGATVWINLIANYEWQIDRDFSVHGGMAHRFTGWSLRWRGHALIKSIRTTSS